MTRYGRFVTGSLTVMLLGSLAAYTLDSTLQNRAISGMSQAQAQQETLPADQARQMERTWSRLDTAVRRDETAGVCQEPAGPEDLPTGQPLLYYLREFERMGYRTINLEQSSRGWVFALVPKAELEQQSAARQPNGEPMVSRYRVTLLMPPEQQTEKQQTVSRVWVLKSAIIGEHAEIPNPALIREIRGEEAIDAVERQIARLKPGAAPTEYIGRMGALGRVTHYRLEPDKAVITLEKEGRIYTVDLILETAQGPPRVSDIQVREDYWRTLLG